MRVLIEQDDGAIIEAKEIQCVPATADILLFYINCFIKPIDATRLGEDLSDKIGRKCIVLGPQMEKVVGIPIIDLQS